MLRFVVLCCCLSLTSSTLSPCAVWNTTGVTVAGTGVPGDSSYQINSAKGMFIHKERNALYVADFYNNRVQMFSLDDPTRMGKTVASGIENPMKVFVDDEVGGPTVYVTLRFLNRTEKWTSGATSGVKVGDDCWLCSGVAVDKEKNVYMSEANRHRVLQWSPRTNTTTVVAGRTDSNGSASDQLDHPQGIYLNRDGTNVYIADMWNSRIQRYISGIEQGATVAGLSNGTAGDVPQALNYPNDVVVDEETNVVYVIDTSNNRVQRWKPLAAEGETIAGGTSAGNATNEFNKPTGLGFDMKGNLYVLDMDNNRVQMFALIHNQPCSVESAANPTLLGSMLMTAILAMASSVLARPLFFRS